MRRLCMRFAFSAVAFVFGAQAVLASGASTSSDSPATFTSCTIGATVPPNRPSFNYRNSEVEPYLAVNPKDSSNLIGVWQQDRWSDGGAHGLTSGASFDGGISWADVPLPFDSCAAPADPIASLYNRASDPWVSIGPDGTAYAVSISVNVNNNDNAVLATTSKNGGTSWSAPKVLKADKGTSATLFEVTHFFNDKESVTADPTRAGVAYAVWDRLVSPSASFDADLHARASRGPSWFSKTTDGGNTWQTKQIFDPGEKNQTIGNVIVVDPRGNGTLYDFFNMILSTGPNADRGQNVAFLKSTDGGNTWSGPKVVSSLLSVGVSDPNNIDPRTNAAPAPQRTGDSTPEPAIDANTGQLYVVWQDSRFNGGKFDEVAISTSTNGGGAWSNPKRVNAASGQPAYTPAIAVNSAGTVGISFYQWSATSSGSEPTTTELKTVPPASIGAADAHSLEAISAAAVGSQFNTLDAPFASGYFLGDYEALATAGTSFLPFFVATNCNDLSCSAIAKVTAPANREPTDRNSTDVFIGRGF